MGLVRDACLIPTYDAPELGYIKESSNEQYVPDVFYKVRYLDLHFGKQFYMCEIYMIFSFRSKLYSLAYGSL